MAFAYAHSLPSLVQPTQQQHSQAFGPLTVCTSHLLRSRRHPDDSESSSETSEDDDEDEEMALDTCLDPPSRGHSSDPRPRRQIPSSNGPETSERARPPIVVTYGPFHAPDVDVAVAYGQMVCYLWFWQPTASALQLQPQPHFIQYLSKVIAQTQLSKTCLVLALHYIWLLKRPLMVGAAGKHEEDMGPVNAPSLLASSQAQAGSQYHVSVVALMLANKFMDDNTYTNKSWAAICGVTLEKINAMEREFLIAINHALHVDVNRFVSWIRIMQSFFIQRQSRFESRSRPRKPLPHAHAYHLAAPTVSSFATPPRSPGYTRARSASPDQFQFTFVPPATSHGRSDHTQSTLPPLLAGRSIHQRPLTQHGMYAHPRPEPAYDSAGSVSSSSSHNLPPWDTRSSRTIASETHSASAVDAPPHPHPLERSRSKRSASQAFSPQSADAPRPRPDERVHHHHQQLLHPHPVRRGRPLSLVAAHHPPSHVHHHHHHQSSGRRLHQVHEKLASRPNSSVEANFARMSLASSSSHAPSPITDERTANQRNSIYTFPHLTAPFDPYTAPSFRNQDAGDGEPLELQYYQLVQGGRGVLRVQPNVAGVSFPVDSAYESQQAHYPHPHQHQHQQPTEFASPYERRERVHSMGGFSSAPETAGSQMRRMVYASRATQSTDDEEGMSGSESSNGTGWEHPQLTQERSSAHIAHEQSQSQSQSQQQQPSYPQSTEAQAAGAGFSLPPLSAILGDTPLRFSSPNVRPVEPSPEDQRVKYAEFANAGPPASYGPQWGFQMPTSTMYHVQYPSLQTSLSFHSPSHGPRSASVQPRQHSSLPHSAHPSYAYDSHPLHHPHLHHGSGTVAPQVYY